MISCSPSLPCEVSRASRILIRPLWEIEPATLWQAVLASQAELARWERWATGAYTLEKAERFVADCRARWKEGSAHAFVILDAVDRRFMGRTTIRLIYRRGAKRYGNLSYWTHSRHAGAGIAALGAAQTARHGFAELGYSRLEIVAQVSNLASRRVAEKVNATFEGIARGLFVHSDEFRDAAVYSLAPPGIAVDPAPAGLCGSRATELEHATAACAREAR